GSADDTLSFTENLVPDGPDVLSGGGGNDIALANTDSNDTRGSISMDGVANDGSGCPGTTCNGDNIGPDIEGVRGSYASEIITGTDGNDSLDGGGGVGDLVQGFGGEDVFTCNSGTY